MRSRLTSLAILAVWLCPWGNIFGGTSGTIAGTVRDKETGVPLPGASVLIQGTTRGAATDRNGFYLIINVPPGRYTLEARMIGFTTVVQKDIMVLVDLRTTVNFELPPTVLEQQEVVITAERPLIQRDVTATAHFISDHEIEYLPIQSVKEIVDLQPGVAAGHIRGGRKTEVLYLVDGIPIQEVIEGEVGSELPNSAIVDMTVQTRGFNAEYGNAMSGVVNIMTKEGSDHFQGRGEVSALNLSHEPHPFRDRRAKYDVITELTLGGPLIHRSLSYFLSTDWRIPDSRWKREQFGDRALIFNSADSYNYNIVGKLSYKVTDNFKVTAQGLLSVWNWTEYDHKWKRNLASLPPRSKKSYRASLSITHTLGSHLFYTAAASQYNVLKSIYGKPSELQRPVVYETDGRGRENPLGFVVAGDYPWWMDHQEIHTVGKVDVVDQLTPNHQLKGGIEVVYYDLYRKNVHRREVGSYSPGFPRYFLYDTDYRYFPIRAAAYLQDKIEYEGLIANVGLRYDLFDPRAWRPAIEKRIVDKDEQWIIKNEERVRASIKHQLSPRMGIALPVTATSEFRANYGFFFQTPLFDYLYTNANLNTAFGFSALGDPDLKPAKTVAYEVGYKHQFAEDYLFDITVFNKDVSNLVDSNTFLNQTRGETGPVSGLTRYVNMALVNVQGAEIFIKKRPGGFLSGKISYTYMVAKGTGSSETQQFEWLAKGYQVPVGEYYLSWDQRHTLVVDLDLRQRGNWGLNLLWRWNSPLPYTKNKGLNTVPNSDRMKATSYIDLRLDKSLSFGKVEMFFYTEVLNLFDTENILWMDWAGTPGGLLQDPGAWDLGRRIRLGIGARLSP